MAFDATGFGQPRLLPATLEDRLVRTFGRVCGIGMLVGIGLLWACFISWSVSDPSLTFATANPARNALGPLGAIISDLLLQTLGLSALLALLAPMLWGIELAFAERMSDTRTRLGCYPLSVLLLAAALSSMPVVVGWPFHHGFGGILGDGAHGVLTAILAPIIHAKAGLAAGGLSACGGLAALLTSVGLEPASTLTAMAVALSRPRRVAAPEANAEPEPETDDETEAEPQDEAAAFRHEPETLDRHTFNDPTFRNRAFRDPSLGDSALDDYEPRLPFGSGLSIAADRAPSAILPHAPQAYPYPYQGSPGQHPVAPPPQAFAYAPQFGPHDPAAFAIAPQPQSAGAVPPLYSVQPYPAQTPPPRHDPAAYAGEPDPAPATKPAPWTGALLAWTRTAAAALAAAAVARAARPAAPVALAIRIPQQPAPAPVPSRPDDAGRNDISELDEGPVASTSRAMAERFAPPGASAGRAPLDPRRPGATLLKGLKFKRETKAFAPPPVSLLKPTSPQKAAPELAQTVLRGSARLLEDVLGDFGVKGEVRDIRPGPVVTLFEFEPARGIKASRVINLADDIARSMSALSVRVAVVPGRNVIGIELPNARRAAVSLRDMLDSDAYRMSEAALPLALGRGIGGEPVVVDLARMPHLLVAGTTGSGKSVGVNAMILSLLFRHSPADCRLLLIDPKMLELSVYNGIPHLLAPVVTDPDKAVAALHWAVSEMEERYKRMAMLSVRNIEVFNNRVRNAKKRGEQVSRTVQTGFDTRTGDAVFETATLALEPLPYIVIVVDEFADLMATAGKDVEAAVQRLAQMARAAGIHLIMATQRPSVDVVTGTIKANFPSRIGFKVASKIDSRTILNDQGAEQLLGHGDMLYATGAGAPIRVHGAFVADEEVEAIAASLRAQAPPDYVVSLRDGPAGAGTLIANGEPGAPREADLYDRAVAVVLRDRKASTSYLQRRLQIGYNRAADLIERMEQEGIVSRADGVGRREILAPAGEAA